MKYTEKAKEALDRILKAYESGDVPEILSRVVIPPLNVLCSRWSLSNRMLVFLSGTDDARGFRQWNEVGRFVKAGTRALYILAPILVRKRKEDEPSDEEKVLKGFHAVPVFRLPACRDATPVCRANGTGRRRRQGGHGRGAPGPPRHPPSGASPADGGSPGLGHPGGLPGHHQPIPGLLLPLREADPALHARGGGVLPPACRARRLSAVPTAQAGGAGTANWRTRPTRRSWERSSAVRTGVRRSWRS